MVPTSKSSATSPRETMVKIAERNKSQNGASVAKPKVRENRRVRMQTARRVPGAPQATRRKVRRHGQRGGPKAGASDRRPRNPATNPPQKKGLTAGRRARSSDRTQRSRDAEASHSRYKRPAPASHLPRKRHGPGKSSTGQQ